MHFKTRFKHFSVHANRFVSIDKVFTAATGIFLREDIIVKKITKPLFKYLRLSIRYDLPSAVIDDGIIAVANKLGVILNLLAITHNFFRLLISTFLYFVLLFLSVLTVFMANCMNFSCY